MPDETNHSPRDVPPEDQGESGSLIAFPRVRQHPPNNLPLQLSSFIGREREVAEVKRLLTGRRLVTLCGSGGCGKTRLVLAVAHEMVEGFEDGVWWVELASLSDPKLVAGAVASALGVREVVDRPSTEVLVEHLEPRKALLVLDNCEHLIEGCAVLADALLRSCPSLQILATSREPLRIAGESTSPVPSLSLPDSQQQPPAAELARYEAIRLFVERAGAADAGFTLTDQNASAVARLCRKLDGIPLAIELAAARVRALTVEQISERLEDPLSLLTTGSRTAAPRHQTLRATLQWSYELLDERERALFDRLSVFAGGWDLEAAEAVGAGEPVQAGLVLDLLSQLVEKSLVVVEPSPVDAGALRYGMLEPVRQYALERLMEGGEAEETRRRHAAYFLALAEEARPKLRAAPQVEWLRRLEKENGNLRGALSWALSADDIRTAARLSWALYMFWWSRNRQPEGRRWTEPIFLRRDKLAPRLRIRIIVVFGAMVYGHGGDVEFLERLSVELMGLSREVGRDALAEANVHVGFGLVATQRGDLEAAKEHLQEAPPLLREAGEDGLAALTHTLFGTVLLLESDHEGARRGFEDGLALARSIGDRMSIVVALFHLAQLALANGDYDAAARGFAEGIAPSQELGDRGNIAHILEALGMVAGARGETLRAARLLGASEALISAIGLRGHPYYRPYRSLYERIAARVGVTLGEVAFEAALDEGRAMFLEQAIEYALEEPATPHGEEEDSQRPAALADVLRVFALGPARVEKDGRPLDSSPDWVHKPRELLYYLLSHPEGRTKEQIGLALWPEASTSQLRSSFHDTMFRLRRALGGKEWIVFEKGRYTFNRSLAYFFDVEAFEENLSEARGVQVQEPEQAIRHLQEAADLYRGGFLEDSVDSEWAQLRQEELQREYQEALLLLGRLLFAQKRHAEAAEAYRKAVSHDVLVEEAHRELMRCYAALGERGLALRHYEELVELLDEQLGTAPAPETRALHERLRAGGEEA